MGLLMFSMGLTLCVVGIPALLIIRYCQMRVSTAEWRMAATLATVFIACLSVSLLHLPILHGLLALTVTQGVRVSASDYHGVGPRLPPAAADISYYSDYCGASAVFSIAEADFANWISSEGWESREIDIYEDVWFPALNIERKVEDGLYIHASFAPRGTGVTLIYDRKQDLCYYRYSSW
jgi:hypothetical protein